MSDVEKEIHDFANFLRKVGTKKTGEDVPLDYRGNIINTALVLIGRRSVLLRHGPDPYIVCVKRLAENGVDAIYLLAKGKVNTWVARYVAEVIKELKIANTAEEVSRTSDLACIRLEVNHMNSFDP